MIIKFYIENRTDKNGDAPIRGSISVQGVRLVVSVGHSVSSAKWDTKRQKVKQGASNSKGIAYNVINTKLSEIETYFNIIENESIIGQNKISIKQLKEEWDNRFSKRKKSDDEIIDSTITAKTFFSLFDDFVKESAYTNNWSSATLAKFKVVKNHLKNFKSNLTFEFLNEKGLVDYCVFLRDKRDMRNSSVVKHVGFLKWFLRWATAKGHNINNDYLNFKPKLKFSERKIIFLTWDELMLVYNFEISETKNYLDRVRDVFCFCCFTSLRYSDVFNLKRSDIKDNALSITTIKTSDSIRIELNKYSKSILDKYSDESFNNNKALPVISNQKMNEYLKELGEMCGLDEPQTVVYFKGNQRIEEVYPKYELLGTHAGRRTFICNALALGIPADVVMKWTGHSDYKAMKPYIDIADQTKVRSMKLFDDL